MIDWRARILERIEEQGTNMEAVSLDAGFNKSYVYSILKGGSSPTIEKLIGVLKHINWTLEDLFGEGAPGGLKLVIQHRILSNEMWADRGTDGTPRELPLSFLSQDLVSLEVETNEYRSAGYRRGDVVSGAPSFGRHIDNLVGTECIVETYDGERLFKVLAKGTARGRYTLKSFDPSQDDMDDVRIKWAAPVQMILRGVL